MMIAGSFWLRKKNIAYDRSIALLLQLYGFTGTLYNQ